MKINFLDVCKSKFLLVPEYFTFYIQFLYDIIGIFTYKISQICIPNYGGCTIWVANLVYNTLPTTMRFLKSLGRYHNTINIWIILIVVLFVLINKHHFTPTSFLEIINSMLKLTLSLKKNLKIDKIG